MSRFTSRVGITSLRGTLAVAALVWFGWSVNHALAGAGHLDDPATPNTIPNNFPHWNPTGSAATFSTQGAIDLTGEYFQAQGTNGRSCATCHIPQDAWSINPGTLQRLFGKTGGTHPVFNPLDANNPDTGNFNTVDGRVAAYSMLLTRGVFRRGGAPRANSEWQLVGVDDPHGFANLTRLVHWRRPLLTINFPLGNATINWEGGNSVGTDQRAGLVNQASRNVTGAQQGSPAPPDVIANIVDFETALFTAQFSVLGVGRLDADGARGGPEALSTMARVEGPFDVFDAWAGDANPRRAQIARGQALFNASNAGGGSCGSCHNVANNGSSMSNIFFDIKTASAAVRTPDLPLYTFENRTTGETVQLTDAGRGNVTGLWRDLGRFKTPTIRALAARAPYFHNGIAPTLESVVRHYEQHLGFIFTDEERADLVAFLSAL